MGYGNSKPTSSVEVYLPSKEIWETLGDLKRPRYWYPSLVILNKRLSCVGGKVKKQFLLFSIVCQSSRNSDLFSQLGKNFIVALMSRATIEFLPSWLKSEFFLVF